MLRVMGVLGRACRTLVLCLLLGGGVIRSTGMQAAGPATAVVIYAANDSGAVFASRDGGVTWQGTLAAKSGVDILALAVSPVQATTAYILEQNYSAGGTLTIQRTQDAGTHWQTLPGPPVQTDDAPVWLTAGAHILYISAVGGVFAAGPTWAWKRLSTQVGPVVLDPQRAGTMVIAGRTQIQLSLNGGTSWSAVGPSHIRIYDVAFDPQDGDAAAAYTAQGIYRSHDGGRTWQHLPRSTAAPVPEDARNTLDPTEFGAGAVQQLNPENPDEVVVVTPQCGSSAACDGLAGFDTIYHSRNGGVTWLVLPNPGPGETALVLPTAPGTLLLGTDDGLFTYDLQTGALSGPVLGTSSIVLLSGAVLRGPDGTIPPSLVPIPVHLPPDTSGHGVVYAGTYRDRIYRSVDGGATWQEADTGLSTAPSAGINAIARAPSAGDRVYAATATQGIFVSTNDGNSWRPDNGGNTMLGMADIRGLVVGGQDGRVSYVSTHNDDLYGSENGRQSWSSLWKYPGSQSLYALAVDGTRATTLFAAGESGIFRSTNSGATWQQVNDTDTSALAVDPSNPAVLYAGGSGDILRTTDDGTTWHSLHAFSGDEDIEVRSLTVDPRHPDRIIAGLYNNFIYRSTDGGTSWHTTDYPGGQLGALVFDPVQGSWALGTSQDGAPLEVTYDDGVHWQPVATPFTGQVFCLAAGLRSSS